MTEWEFPVIHVQCSVKYGRSCVQVNQMPHFISFIYDIHQQQSLNLYEQIYNPTQLFVCFFRFTHVIKHWTSHQNAAKMKAAIDQMEKSKSIRVCLTKSSHPNVYHSIATLRGDFQEWKYIIRYQVWVRAFVTPELVWIGHFTHSAEEIKLQDIDLLTGFRPKLAMDYHYHSFTERSEGEWWQ